MENDRNGRSFDIIVYGATGFTGELVCEYLSKKSGLRLGLAGRNKEKLEKLKGKLENLKEQIKTHSIGIVIADTNDLKSLNKMVSQTVVLCNCVGPYLAHGYNIIEACVTEGTHYTDLCGEVPWIRKVVQKFHHTAQEKKLKIVPACGFDSIPSDLGVWLLQKECKKRELKPFSDIVLYVEKSKGTLSGGTAAAIVGNFDFSDNNKLLAKDSFGPYALYPEGTPKGPHHRDLKTILYDEKRERWIGPFMMAGINTRVVRRTNALLNFPYGEDFKYEEVSVYSSKKKARKFLLFGGLFVLGLKFSLTRKLVHKVFLPKQGDGPSFEQREKGSFKFRITPKDWNSDFYVSVEGFKDPGYGSTSIMLGEASLCLLKKSEETTPLFGVLTPASGMGMALIDQLNDNQIHFKIEGQS